VHPARKRWPGNDGLADFAFAMAEAWAPARISLFGLRAREKREWLTKTRAGKPCQHRAGQERGSVRNVWPMNGDDKLVRDGDDYVLNGEKNHGFPMGGIADVYCVFCADRRSAGRQGAFSLSSCRLIRRAWKFAERLEVVCTAAAGTVSLQRPAGFPHQR